MVTDSVLARWPGPESFLLAIRSTPLPKRLCELHAVAAPQARSSAPDYRRVWAGHILVERIRMFIQRRPAPHRWTRGYRFGLDGRGIDIFGADDVAARVARWPEVLKSATRGDLNGSDAIVGPVLHARSMT